MTRAVVTLNQNTSSGAQVATWQDAGSQMHQMVVMETQTGTSDPVAVGASNPLPITAPVPLNVVGNIAAGTTDSGFGIKISAVYNASPPTYTTGQRSDLQSDAAGNLCVNIKAGAAAGGTSSAFGSAFPANGTAMGFLNSGGTLMAPGNLDASGNLKINLAVGGVPAQQDNTAFTAGTTVGLMFDAVYNDGISALTSGSAGGLRCSINRQLLVGPQAVVSGGATPFTQVNAATNNATQIKASPGQIWGIEVVNTSAALVYLKLFDATTVTMGTTVPVKNIPIPANSQGAGVVIPYPVGLKFTTGIYMALTAGIAATDNTPCPTGAVAVTNINYS